MSKSPSEPHSPPLAGSLILVTRARHQADELARLLEREGARVLSIPTIEIAAPVDPAPVDRAVRALESYDWVIFASVNAVDSLVDRIVRQGHTATEKLGRAKLAAVGAATAKRLAELGLTVTFVPSRFVAECLVEEFPERENIADLKVLLPKTAAGETVIEDYLKEKGARVDAVESYRTLAPVEMQETAMELKRALSKEPVDVITVASSESARNLARLLYLVFAQAPAEPSQPVEAGVCAASLEPFLDGIGIVAIGPKTCAAARLWLGKCDRQAQQFDLNGLVEATRDFLAQSKRRRKPGRPSEDERSLAE